MDKHHKHSNKKKKERGIRDTKAEIKLIRPSLRTVIRTGTQLLYREWSGVYYIGCWYGFDINWSKDLKHGSPHESTHLHNADLSFVFSARARSRARASVLFYVIIQVDRGVNQSYMMLLIMVSMLYCGQHHTTWLNKIQRERSPSLMSQSHLRRLTVLISHCTPD